MAAYRICVIHILGNERPQLKDIENDVGIRCAPYWKQLGRNLNITEDLLSIIETDCPHNCVSCCSKMLSDWLDSTPNASWGMLYDAVDKTQNMLSRLPDTADKLYTAAEKLPGTVDKLESAAERLNELPKAMDQFCKAIGELPKILGEYVPHYGSIILQVVSHNHVTIATLLLAIRY